MSAQPSLSALLASAREVEPLDRAARQRELQPRWDSLVSEAQRAWSGAKLWDNTYLPLEPSFRLRLYQGEVAAVLMVSIVAPVHHLYVSPGSAAMEQGAPGLIAEREALGVMATRLMGTSAMPPEWLEEPMPGESNLGERLFGGHWW